MRAEISLSGTVLANEWSNPHVYSSLETAEGGDTATWEIEGGAVAMMRCHGGRRWHGPGVAFVHECSSVASDGRRARGCGELR